MVNQVKTETSKDYQIAVVFDHTDGKTYSVEFELEWDSSITDSNAYVKSVNGIDSYCLEKDFKRRLEWRILRNHEAKLEKENEESKEHSFSMMHEPAFCVNCGRPAKFGGFCSITCQTQHWGE